MKINITKAQYRQLIKGISLANATLGRLGDVSKESDYKPQSNELNEFEDYLLQFAKDFDYEEVLDESGHMDDDFYTSAIMPILDNYDDYTTQNNLANKLAWRDFRKDHSKEEMERMAEANGGYFGTEIYDYEKKYWDEFETYEFDRLEVLAPMRNLSKKEK